MGNIDAQPAHNEPPPLCYSSVWLSMNVLVLDPKTVCVEKSEKYQAEQLDKLGMSNSVELRDAYAFGGEPHCCTADVYRRRFKGLFSKTIKLIRIFLKINIIYYFGNFHLVYLYNLKKIYFLHIFYEHMSFL